MSEVGETQSGRSTLAVATPTMRILFVLRTLHQLRYFQSTLELLADRGHALCLMLEYTQHGPREEAWLAEVLTRPNVTLARSGSYRGMPMQEWGVKLRIALEYLHFRAPEYRSRPRYLRNVARRSPPRLVRALALLPGIRGTSGRRLLYRILDALERVVADPTPARMSLQARRPDVLVLADAGSRASVYVAFARAAQELGIPTASCVSSWDNLTTRPPMRTVPSKLLVWNEQQVEEAVRIHGIPEDRVVSTGAPSFDQWFTWRARPSEDFIRRIGLAPSEHRILWVGSALNPWEPAEVPFVQAWLRGLRSSRHHSLREAGVVLRPHPLRMDQWHGAGFSDFGNVVVWPKRNVSMPIDVEQKSDYYDSIFHSHAVVGINTSAMIEASIIGRPVMTILDAGYHDSQFGALHFSYLLDSAGGVLRVSESLDEHLDALAEVLANSGDRYEAAREFAHRFARPHGLQSAVTPRVVEEIEQLATLAQEPVAEQRAVVACRRLVRPLAVTSYWLANPKRRRRIKNRTRRTVRRTVIKPLRSRRKRFVRALRRNHLVVRVARPLRRFVSR
ncbi:MAG TPA: hypothetical protein VFJ93_09270 [Gaiellaceae bacterium]|nr:hypothetical protein [Gaiellaceae bacterium]